MSAAARPVRRRATSCCAWLTGATGLTRLDRELPIRTMRARVPMASGAILQFHEPGVELEFRPDLEAVQQRWARAELGLHPRDQFILATQERERSLAEGLVFGEL